MPTKRTTSNVVQFVPPAPAEPDYDALADTLLAVAAEVAEAEEFLREEAIAALDAGDAARARQILSRWRTEPPTDLAASLRGKRCG